MYDMSKTSPADFRILYLIAELGRLSLCKKHKAFSHLWLYLELNYIFNH